MREQDDQLPAAPTPVNEKTKAAPAAASAVPPPPTLQQVRLEAPGWRPADLTTLFFVLFLTGLTIAGWPTIPHARLFLSFHAGVIIVLGALARFPIPAAPPILRLLRQFHPVPIYPLLFSELREIIPAVSWMDKDWLLIRLDQILCGGQPSVMLARFHHPLLTEILQVIYALFYFIPLGLAVLLVVKKRWILHDYYLFLTCYGFILSYLGYFLVPAIGPRFTIRDQYPFPLTGVWLYQFISDGLNRMEGINRDCFPSGHTMMTLVTLHFAFIYERGFFFRVLPVGGALIVATVYLRYHYGVDLLAGTLFYLFAYYTAKPVYRSLFRS